MKKKMGTGVLGLAALEKKEKRRRTMVCGVKAASHANYWG